MGRVRSRKIAGIIKSELSVIIDTKLRDPRKKMITITEVRLNHDMSVATVFFTSMGDEEEKKTALDVLKSAKPFLKSQLSPALQIRKMPDLKFEVDNSYEYGSKINTLLNKIKSNEQKNEEE